MNKDKLKNIILEEFEKIKHALQEQTTYIDAKTDKGLTDNELKSKYNKMFPDGKSKTTGKSFSFNQFINYLIDNGTIKKRPSTSNVGKVGLPNETDKTTIGLIIASSFESAGGTLEELFKTCLFGGSYGSVNLSGITTLKEYQTVDNNLQTMLTTLNRVDKAFDAEYIYLRNGKAESVSDRNIAKKRVTSDLPNISVRGTVRKKSTQEIMIKHGIVSDRIIDQTGYTDATLRAGIGGLIESEFSEGTDQDEILIHLLNYGFAYYENNLVKISVPNTDQKEFTFKNAPLEVGEKFVNGRKTKQYEL